MEYPSKQEFSQQILKALVDGIMTYETDSERPPIIDCSKIVFSELPAYPLSPSCQCIAECREEEFHVISEWIRNEAIPLKAEYDAKLRMTVLTPMVRRGDEHQMSIQNAIVARSNFNRQNAGNEYLPLIGYGSADVRCIDGSILKPDGSQRIS